MSSVFWVMLYGTYKSEKQEMCEEDRKKDNQTRF